MTEDQLVIKPIAVLRMRVCKLHVTTGPATPLKRRSRGSVAGSLAEPDPPPCVRIWLRETMWPAAIAIDFIKDGTLCPPTTRSSGSEKLSDVDEAELVLGILNQNLKFTCCISFPNRCIKEVWDVIWSLFH